MGFEEPHDLIALPLNLLSNNWSLKLSSPDQTRSSSPQSEHRRRQVVGRESLRLRVDETSE